MKRLDRRADQGYQEKIKDEYRGEIDREGKMNEEERQFIYIVRT